MRLMIISQRDRVVELEHLLETSRGGTNRTVIICPSKKLLSKSDLEGVEIFEYLSNYQFGRIQLTNFSKELRLRFVRLLRSGTSLGFMTERIIKFMISIVRREYKTVSEQKSKAMLTVSNQEWVSPHHDELTLTLENVLNRAEVELIEFFDIVDLEVVSSIGRSLSIPISLR